MIYEYDTYIREHKKILISDLRAYKCMYRSSYERF